jgi:CBS domain-containing membrane protein
MAASRQERLRGGIGALIGLFLTGLICTHATGGGMATPLLIAPMGASALLLFAVPSSPLAQPWPVVGGYLTSAIVGVSCAGWLSFPLLAASLAVALSILAMSSLRCLHPPSAAVALMAVLGGPQIVDAGYIFVITPVALNAVVLVLAAIAYNNATKRAYPHPQQSHAAVSRSTADRSPLERLGVHREDLDAVLEQYGQVLDVARDDLEGLFQRAEMQAYHRRFGEITCADIMSRDVVSVEFGTALQDAWLLLRRHNIRSLPVLDRARRVIGMVSDLDFMVSADLDLFDDLRSRFRRVIGKPMSDYASRPEVVGQIMPRGVRTVSESTHVVELVPLMADAGLRHVAVVDDERRLSGIISQSDLVAALYRGGLSQNAGAA